MNHHKTLFDLTPRNCCE